MYYFNYKIQRIFFSIFTKLTDFNSEFISQF